jgi:hypothetical protein
VIDDKPSPKAKASAENDDDPDFCEVLNGAFNRSSSSSTKSTASGGGFVRRSGKGQRSLPINQWIEIVAKIQEEKDRVEGEHTKTLEKLRDALSETARSEAETLQGIVDRVRGASDASKKDV